MGPHQNRTMKKTPPEGLEAASKLGCLFEIKARAQGQPAGMLIYAEDVRQGLNADIGLKDFLRMASDRNQGVSTEGQWLKMAF